MPNYPDSLVQGRLIRVPNDLISAYREVLNEYGIYDEALKPPPTKSDVVGGAGEQETLEHFAHRFILSASRVQFVLLDQNSELDDISVDLRTSLASGAVTLLDAPSGTGASLLSLLSVLAALRDEEYTPKLPLNIAVCSGDVSPTALDIQQKLLNKITPWLRSTGIVVDLTQTEWDASREDQSAALVDAWFGISTSAHEYLVMVAAFSGVGAQGFDDYSDSFRHFAARLHAKLATLLWIEPKSNAGSKFLRKVKALIGKLSWLKPSPDRELEAEFYWWHDLKKYSPGRPSGALIRRYLRGDRP